MNEQIIFDFLKTNHVPYTLFDQPVFTISDKPIVTAIDGNPTSSGTIPRPHFKTLFLKDKKNNIFFLVSVIEDKRVDLKALSDALGCGRFSFGKAEELCALLILTPGSVTPYGLMFDKERKVTFILDEDALAYPNVSFHPMRNDMTVVTNPQDFLICMEKMQHKPRIIHIPVQQQSI
jgi:Ala-tRNA(Pro) deacylase